MLKRINISGGEWSICVFPLCIMFGEAVDEHGVKGSAISIGFLIWSITLYIWK